MKGLLDLDRAAFVFLNGRVHTAWLDRFFPFLTDLDHFRIVLITIWVALVLFGGARGRRAALLVSLAVGLTDVAVNDLVKTWVGRTRPCVAVAGARVLVGFAHSPSFPSSHAANIVAAASVLWAFYRRPRPLFATVAFLVAYSRIYVGLHYPLDVVGGAVIGAGVAVPVLAAGPILERGLVALGASLRFRRGRVL